MPTGGVTLDNAGEWIKAGAFAVGVGSALVDTKAIDAGRFEIITANAQKVMQSVRSVRL
jgi:2-dehydro-3-deoxyphosphogluconate aldolase / (4S)-4-hydroxy-2-oxoglutarate aldolase